VTADDHGVMSQHDRIHGQAGLSRFTRRMTRVIAECNYAQRTLLERIMDPRRCALPSMRAPDTYQEFLLWTSGRLPHEPSAAARAAR
jgi:hypothetical protein